MKIQFRRKSYWKALAVPFTGAMLLLAITARADDPRTNCWLTTFAGKYARVYTNDAMETAGNTLTNWAVGSLAQTKPVYCGVQEVYSSTNWVYVRSTGLASYNMGPWQNGSFPNLPTSLLFPGYLRYYP